MKITVLGAGAIGSAVAYDLCQNDAVTRVQVCEARPVVLRAFRALVAHPKLRTHEADARDEASLEPVLMGSACVVSCVTPDLNPRLARLALRLGAHFVDLGGPGALRDPYEGLDTIAAARGRWVLTGNGLAPGLVNVLCRQGLDRMDETHAVRVRVGDVPMDPSGPFAFRLAHSAEKLLDDYTQPVAILRGGRLETAEPLTGVEIVDVDEFGPLEAFYADGGLGALAHALEGRVDRLDVKMLRPPGHAAQMRFLLDLGFADRTTLDVRTHLTYRDVLTRRLRQRLGGAYRDAVLVRVEMDGRRGDTEGTLTYTLVDRFDEASGLSAMQRCTGFPAAEAAVLLAGRHVEGGGVGAVEDVVPREAFLEAVADRGLAIEERWEPSAAAVPA